MAAAIEIEVDARKRLPLARLDNIEPNSRFRVERQSDGSLLLIPVFSISAHELEILSNPEALARWKALTAEAKHEADTGELLSFSFDDDEGN